MKGDVHEAVKAQWCSDPLLFQSQPLDASSCDLSGSLAAAAGDSDHAETMETLQWASLSSWSVWLLLEMETNVRTFISLSCFGTDPKERLSNVQLVSFKMILYLGIVWHEAMTSCLKYFNGWSTRDLIFFIHSQHSWREVQVCAYAVFLMATNHQSKSDDAKPIVVYKITPKPVSPLVNIAALMLWSPEVLFLSLSCVTVRAEQSSPRTGGDGVQPRG